MRIALTVLSITTAFYCFCFTTMEDSESAIKEATAAIAVVLAVARDQSAATIMQLPLNASMDVSDEELNGEDEFFPMEAFDFVGGKIHPKPQHPKRR